MILGVLALWLVASAVLGVVIGKSIALANRSTPRPPVADPRIAALQDELTAGGAR